MAEFTWIKSYKEIAEKLLDYEDKQQELIDILKELKEQGLPMIRLTDRDRNGQDTALKEIDPFTFYSVWNRGIKDQNRIAILNKLKEKFSLSTPIPSDFAGIPVMSSMNSWFFTWKNDRAEDAISRLWGLFKEAVVDGDITEDTFNSVLRLQRISYNITMGLYWINPEKYINLDKVNRDYLKDKYGIEAKFKDYQDYLRIIDEVRDKINKPYYELSYDAWMESQGTEEGADDEASSQGKSKLIWKRFGNGYNLKLANPEQANFKKLSKLLNEVVDADSEFRFNKTVNSKFHELFNRSTDILSEQAYAVLSNWFMGEGPRYSQSPRKEKAKELWNALFCAFPQNRLTHTKRGKYEKIKPEEFQIWWEKQQKCQNEENDGGGGPMSSNYPLNQILYGPPGTGKTYKTYEIAVQIADPDFGSKERKDVMERYKVLKDANRIEFITFHQSYSYEEFFEGLRPELGTEELKYKIKDGILKMIAKEAEAEPAKNYVLIIDEINRANISKVFGEAVTLLESDKRLKRENETVIYLPYSKQAFGIPDNLYIIGTMNTADRSIALMDIALRRRFKFLEMMPESFLIEQHLNQKGLNNDFIKLLKVVLDKLNRRILLLLDRDHQIGHSYFLKIEKEEDLLDIWNEEIVPLVQEYFYNDWERLKQLLTSPSDDSITFIKDVSAKENELSNETYVDFIGEIKKPQSIGELKEKLSGVFEVE